MHRTARPAAFRIAVAAAALALVPALAACGSGVTAGTSLQGPSGNGANVNVGPVQLRAITVVQAKTGTAATIIGTIVILLNYSVRLTFVALVIAPLLTLSLQPVLRKLRAAGGEQTRAEAAD